MRAVDTDFLLFIISLGALNLELGEAADRPVGSPHYAGKREVFGLYLWVNFCGVN